MDIVFTTDNLIENIKYLGTWSAYGLATEALQHYYPESYDNDGYCSTEKEIELLKRLNCKSWHDIVVKYHKEVGYKGKFNPDAVNQS